MRRFVVAFACAMVLTACGGEVPEMDDAIDMVSEIPVFSNAYISGDLGESEGIDKRGEYVLNYENEYSASVSMFAEGDDRAVMAMLQIDNGNFDHPDFQFGSMFELHRYGHSPNGANVDLIGCEGPAIHNWDFDAPARDVFIAVGHGDLPLSRRIHYTATWESLNGDEPFTLVGYFDVE